tara:strand:+ start:87 stop:1028 length:942 start_codon:yes stop_codon:yes gene_type:complete
MGLSLANIQNILELKNLGYFKNSNSVIEIGSQELHINMLDLKELFEIAGLDKNLIDTFPNVKNWPFSPRCSSKHLYKALGINNYESIDINGEHEALVHDLNKPFEDKSKFNKFDIVTDFGSCEHVFNIAECYKTMHKLTKPGGYLIIAQATIKGNGFFTFDESFYEGIAAANGYKIIYSSYYIKTGNKTKNGSWYEFHIPRNEELLNVLDYGKLRPKDSRSTYDSGISIYGVFQKINDDEFKMPYQGGIHNKDVYSMAGFNRGYLKQTMDYLYIPSAKMTVEDASLVVILKSLLKWFKKKTRTIIRKLIMKIK